MLSFEQFSQDEWLMLAVLVAVGLTSLFFSIRKFHLARLIEDMPTSKIRSAAQGYVELYGIAKWLDGPQIIAPLSGQACVWYSYIIEERNQFGKSEWRHVASEVSDHLFLLQDETGSCVIDPEGADVTPSASETWYGTRAVHTFNSSTINFVTDALSHTIGQIGARYRYTEKRLHIENELYAIGEFKSIGTDFRASLNDLSKDFLSKLKRDKTRLAVYDTNKDGEVDAQEWQQARADAKQFAVEEQLKNPLPASTNLLTKPESKRYKPFILSANSETHLSRKQKLFSYLLAVVFILCIGIIFSKLTGKF